MRILVVGAGRMGALRAEDLAADPRVEQVLVTNRTPGRAAEVAARTGGATVAWDELAAAAARADAVVVAPATAAHAEVLEAVLPLGRPVLCEKPVATTLAETRRAVDRAAAHGTAVQVGFQRRFDAGLRAAHDLARTGALGTLYALRLLSHDHVPVSPEFIASSGGIFRDLAVHDLDLVAWLTGSPVATVHATVAVREHRRFDVRHPSAAGPVPDGDVAVVHAVTASGVQVSLHEARHDPRGHDVRAEVYGSGDSVAAGLNERTPVLALDGPPPGPAPYRGFVDRFREAFRAETAAFVGLVAGGPNPCPPEAAFDALRAAIGCELSVLRGGPVDVTGIGAADH
ncbi:Gfo/Idh/MocA family oxidoreductase [Kineosporia sp. R_H_3]|uniref:Gfo/Idh/MocA family oxidoreductase n=1 Tax=Kineosporia sp. R_H_3 TaxID=1961848 RepID=UPI000B4B0235|nr:Gfo/Idh/MocA family oxidoreductase [Kineosporia sp. R_H_3]